MNRIAAKSGLTQFISQVIDVVAICFQFTSSLCIYSLILYVGRDGDHRAEHFSGWWRQAARSFTHPFS